MTTVSAFQTLSYVSEGAIFIYVGMDTLDPLKWQVHTLAFALLPLRHCIALLRLWQEL